MTDQVMNHNWDKQFEFIKGEDAEGREEGRQQQ